MARLAGMCCGPRCECEWKYHKIADNRATSLKWVYQCRLRKKTIDITFHTLACSLGDQGCLISMLSCWAQSTMGCFDAYRYAVCTASSPHMSYECKTNSDPLTQKTAPPSLIWQTTQVHMGFGQRFVTGTPAGENSAWNEMLFKVMCSSDAR